MKRNVTGSIKKLDESPWENFPVVFQLQPGSYESDIYPNQTIRVLTDSEGLFEVELWCNETGIEPSVYKCNIGNDTFLFTVPIGIGDIELTTLRQLGVQPFPTPIPIQVDRRELFVPNSGQTVFTLAESPTHPQLSRVWVNGLKYSYITDYMINGVLLTWLSPIRLENTDYFEVLY